MYFFRECGEIPVQKGEAEDKHWIAAIFIPSGGSGLKTGMTL